MEERGIGGVKKRNRYNRYIDSVDKKQECIVRYNEYIWEFCQRERVSVEHKENNSFSL